MNRAVSIACTLGPASLSELVIRSFERLGVGLLRINLSHTELSDIPRVLSQLALWTDIPVCLDSEGAQVRTGRRKGQATTFEVGQRITIGDADLASPGYLQLVPKIAVDQLIPGDELRLDFDGAQARVDERSGAVLLGTITCGGAVGCSRGVDLARPIWLPGITKKDSEAIAIARTMGVNHFAMSFVNRKEDVLEMRSLIGDSAHLISKIETIEALVDLSEIMRLSDSALIDRGDLSRKVAIERIPVAQKLILAHSREVGCPTFVATNLLESMINSKSPTRAEVNDVYNCLEDGAAGLVLAAETAIGQYPVECVEMLSRVVDAWRENQSIVSLEEFLSG